MSLLSLLAAQPWARRIAFWAAVAAAVVLVYLRMESQSRKVGALAEKLDAANAAAKAERKMLDEVQRANEAASRAVRNAAAAPGGLPEHDPFRRD